MAMLRSKNNRVRKLDRREWKCNLLDKQKAKQEAMQLVRQQTNQRTGKMANKIAEQQEKLELLVNGTARNKAGF